MKIFVRTLNNIITSILTHQHHYSLELNTPGCQNLEWDAKWIEKFVKEILHKGNKNGGLNILGTENSSIEPDEIMLKFTHCKIETN